MQFVRLPATTATVAVRAPLVTTVRPVDFVAEPPQPVKTTIAATAMDTDAAAVEPLRDNLVAEYTRGSCVPRESCPIHSTSIEFTRPSSIAADLG
jgi:hypothetical protein